MDAPVAAQRKLVGWLLVAVLVLIAVVTPGQAYAAAVSLDPSPKVQKAAPDTIDNHDGFVALLPADPISTACPRRRSRHSVPRPSALGETTFCFKLPSTGPPVVRLLGDAG